jgi:hypothetical protein
MKRLLVHCLLATAGLLAFGERRASAQFIPEGLGHYAGFFRSYGDPNELRGMVEFDITQQVGPTFSGQLTLVSNGLRLPFPFTGMVDATGAFRGTGQGLAGRVAFLGSLRNLGGRAAYVTAGYEFVPTLGNPTQGIANLLRNFVGNPDLLPPVIDGNWTGTFASARGLPPDPCRLVVQQDRTSTGAPGTGFRGQLFRSDLTFDVVGTINGRGQFYFIGQGAAGNVLVQGQVAPPDPVHPATARASYLLVLVNGSTDFGTIDITEQVGR